MNLSQSAPDLFHYVWSRQTLDVDNGHLSLRRLAQDGILHFELRRPDDVSKQGHVDIEPFDKADSRTANDRFGTGFIQLALQFVLDFEGQSLSGRLDE
ncbi:hypothetical protein D3C76_1310570 [compost metagenome]